jgi:hypothetical protein
MTIRQLPAKTTFIYLIEPGINRNSKKHVVQRTKLSSTTLQNPQVVFDVEDDLLANSMEQNVRVANIGSLSSYVLYRVDRNSSLDCSIGRSV